LEHKIGYNKQNQGGELSATDTGSMTDVA